MRTTLRIPARIWSDVRSQLFDTTQERFAYLLGRGSRVHHPWLGNQADVYIRRAVVVPDDALLVQSAARVEVDGAFTMEVLRGCYSQGLSLIDVHTHPFWDSQVSFSGHDQDNMELTHRDFHEAIPQEPPAFVGSLVLGRNSTAGAFFEPDQEEVSALDRLQLIGDHLEEIPLCSW